MKERIRLGETRPMHMRRIGAQHMLVMPPQVAQVLSLDDLQRARKQIASKLALIGAEQTQLANRLVDIDNQLKRFRELPVERDENDPDVPQHEPPAAEPSPTVEPAAPT